MRTRIDSLELEGHPRIIKQADPPDGPWELVTYAGEDTVGAPIDVQDYDDPDEFFGDLARKQEREDAVKAALPWLAGGLLAAFLVLRKKK